MLSAPTPWRDDTTSTIEPPTPGLPPFVAYGEAFALAAFHHRGEAKIWWTPGTTDVVRMLMRCRFGRGWLAQAARLPLQSLHHRIRVRWRDPIERWLRALGLTGGRGFVAQRGSAGLFRKYVVLGIGEDRRPAWVLKRSDAPDSRASMVTEARALPALVNLLGDAGRVPALHGEAALDGAFFTAQEACVAPDAPVERAWTAAHHRFCERLGSRAAAEPHRLWAQAILQRERLRARILEVRPRAASAVEAAGALLAHATEAIEFDRVPLGWVHRDFTPWNVFPAAGALTVVDWEWADPTWVPLHDCLHFLWFPRLLGDELDAGQWRLAFGPEGAAAVLARALGLPGRHSGYAALYLYDTLLFYADAVRREGRDPADDGLVGRLTRSSLRMLALWRSEERA